MDTWVLFYMLDTLFWLWVIYWGGAEWLQGTLSSGLLISYFAPTWTVGGIKLFAWLTLIISTIWFVCAIFEPSLRLI